MEIISDGIFRLPLYHGTTSIFMDSIQKFGLGGINAIVKYEAEKFYDCLYNIANNKLENDQEWNSVSFAADLVKEQGVTDTGYNFKRNGSVYLTPSKLKAIQYAKKILLGSILHNAITSMKC